MTEPRSSPGKSFTQNTEAWGNHQDLWCKKACISRFIFVLFVALPYRSLILVHIIPHATHTPSNYFAYQRHETGYHVDYTGINVIVTCDITSVRGEVICFVTVPFYCSESERHQRSVLHLSLCDSAVPRESNVTDAFSPCLTFSITSILCLCAPLRVARWQVYRVIKFERQENCYAARLWLSTKLQSGSNEHITPPKHLNSPSLPSPVWPTDWAKFRCSAGFG